VFEKDEGGYYPYLTIARSKVITDLFKADIPIGDEDRPKETWRLRILHPEVNRESEMRVKDVFSSESLQILLVFGCDFSV